MSPAACGDAGVRWIPLGYSLACEPGSRWVGGLSWIGLRCVTGAPHAICAGTTPHILSAAFPGMCAVIRSALIPGTFAERMRLRAFPAIPFLSTARGDDPLTPGAVGSPGEPGTQVDAGDMVTGESCRACSGLLNDRSGS